MDVVPTAIEETTDHGGWLLTPKAKSAARQQHGPVRDYEQRLLDGLANGGGESHLSSLADSFGQVLDETRKALIHDAVPRLASASASRQRTAKGEDSPGTCGRSAASCAGWWLTQIRSSRGRATAVALRFGLLSDQPTPLVRFAQAWVRAFADLPGWVPPKPGPTEYGSDQPLFASVETIHGGGLIGFIY